LKEVLRFQGWKRNFEDNIVWDIGNRREISLWEDGWLGDGSLKGKFPRLFSISSCREAKLRQAGEWNNNVEWSYLVLSLDILKKDVRPLILS